MNVLERLKFIFFFFILTVVFRYMFPKVRIFYLFSRQTRYILSYNNQLQFFFSIENTGTTHREKQKKTVIHFSVYLTFVQIIDTRHEFIHLKGNVCIASNKMRENFYFEYDHCLVKWEEGKKKQQQQINHI